jgi:TolA-binding protein
MNKQSQVRPVRPGRSARPATMTAAVLVAGCAVGLAACSSGTSTGSSSHTAAPRTTSPSASPAHSGSAVASSKTCKHVSSLRASLESLTHLQLNAGSAGQIRTNLTKIQTQLTALKGQAGGSLSLQVSQLSHSLNQVKTAASNLSSPPSASQVSKVVTALSNLKTQSKGTVAEMNAACPKG